VIESATRGEVLAMVFLGKKFSDLQIEDLQRLVNDQVQETDIIEYKREMYGNSDAEKREMLKDITSMANHRGGYLLIGIDENDEGVPTKIVGIEPGKHDERITSCYLDNVDKRILGLAIRDIPLDNGRVVIVISIPESINAPHMVTQTGLNQFWKRHGRQKDKMTIDEIGEAFDRSFF
jgi:predicted HTH transcriptional regulator